LLHADTGDAAEVYALAAAVLARSGPDKETPQRTKAHQNQLICTFPSKHGQPAANAHSRSAFNSQLVHDIAITLRDDLGSRLDGSGVLASTVFATMSNGRRDDCSRNADFAHPVLMIIRNCSRIRGSYNGCRIRTIISNRGSPTSGVVTCEQ